MHHSGSAFIFFLAMVGAGEIDGALPLGDRTPQCLHASAQHCSGHPLSFIARSAHGAGRQGFSGPAAPGDVFRSGLKDGEAARPAPFSVERSSASFLRDSPGDLSGIAPGQSAERSPPPPSSTSALPARTEDARVARVAFRLATEGRAQCPQPVPAFGLVLQHLSQFRRADRPGMIAAYNLDRGPGIVAVVPGSPADQAGMRAGDVLLLVGGKPLQAEAATAEPFDQQHARARADQVLDLLGAAGLAPVKVTLLRDGTSVETRIAPLPGCPSRVHLARSDQRNAYADGRHVFLTTRLLKDTVSDDELAFVLAHEMAHNILGHAAVMRGSTVKHGLGRTLGRSGRVVRGTERAADALGGTLMLDAGYDPVVGAGVLRRLGGGDLGITLFSEHDSVSDRLAALRALAAARKAR